MSSLHDALSTLSFTPPKRVNTKLGERLVSSASPTPEFWAAWKIYKDEIKKSGYSVTKDNGAWMVTRWESPNEDLVEEKAQTKELSRAKDLDVEIPVPDGLEYLGFQKAGIWFAKDKDTLIADSMGLGKTVQAIGVLNLHDEYENVLVICPASLRLNWMREMNKWMVKPRTIGYVERNDYPENTDIVVINYDVVERHLDKINSRDWDLLIIDESHYLKNPKAKRTKAILGDGKGHAGIKAKHKLFLTGTPILNRPVEIFPLINALDPDNWPKFWPFGLRYCNGHKNSFGWDFSGASNLQELQERLRSTIMVRRLKEEVLTELPPKRRQVIELPPTPKITSLLKKEKDAWERQEDVIRKLRVAVELAKVNGTKEEFSAAVRNLNEGITASFSEMAVLRQEIALEKVPYVVEHVKDIAETGEKVVIFAHHKSVVAALKEALGDEAVTLVGDTKLEDRQAAVDAFQNDPAIKYFIGSIKAAGVGITLTAASNVVFAELDWVPGNLSQAEDRCVLEGEPVLTETGWKPIEDVEIGDMVLSHDGKLHKVTDKWSRLARGARAADSKDIAEISVLGWHRPIKVTTDHKVLTTRGWVEAGDLRPRDVIKMPEPDPTGIATEVSVTRRVPTTFSTQEMNIFGDFYEEPRVKPATEQRNGRLVTLADSVELNEDSMFVFGYYLGDGFSHTGKGKGRFVSFSGNNSTKADALQKCSSWVEKLGVATPTLRTPSDNGNGRELRAYSAELAYFFEENFGRVNSDKHVPAWVWGASPELRRALISGWSSADGYYRAGRTSITTVSPRLAADLTRLLISVGEKPCVYEREPRQDNSQLQYVVEWTEGQPQGLVVQKVLLRTCTKTERVYDLTVEDASSFVIGTSVVHNCARIGQKNSVLVQHLVMENSLDAKMAKTVIDKQEIIDKALDVEIEVEPSIEIDLTALKLPSYEKIEKEAKEANFTEEEKEELLTKLRILASFDADMAREQNNVGFNKMDSMLGHSLAQQDRLTDKQALVAKKLVTKYRRQLGDVD